MNATVLSTRMGTLLRWLAGARRVLRLACVLLGAALAGGLAQAQIQVIDDMGVVVQLDKPPARVVSLLPSLTESTCALGACDRLVGVDRYSNWPAHIKHLPVVGGGLDPNVEAIVALRPDVVLVSTATRASDRLRALGLRVVALEPRTQAGVRRVLDTLARLLGLPPDAGARQWRQIEAGVAAAAQSLPAQARGQRVYFEVSRGPYAAGPSSFMGETLTQLGLGNVVGPELGPFPKLNPEFIVRADPDVIMAGNRSSQDMVLYPGWHTLRAVRAGRVCVFDAAQSDLLVRPGPRMAEGARLMAECVRRHTPAGKAATR